MYQEMVQRQKTTLSTFNSLSANDIKFFTSHTIVSSNFIISCVDMNELCLRKYDTCIKMRFKL